MVVHDLAILVIIPGIGITPEIFGAPAQAYRMVLGKSLIPDDLLFPVCFITVQVIGP